MKLKLNYIRVLPENYTPPPIPEGPHGPEELTELLVESRKHSPQLNGPISDEGLRKLVKLVYFASQMPEEGRYLRYKLICEQPTDSADFVVTRTDPIRLDSPDQMRRLGPACNHPNCAILIEERDGCLWFEGVLNIGGMGYETDPEHPGLVRVERPPRLLLEVFGPGHLRSSEAHVLSYELRAGRIRPLSAYHFTDPMRSLIRSVQSRVTRDVLAHLSDEGNKFKSRMNDGNPVQHVFSTMLRTAADTQHGGAFVFLPDASCKPKEYGLEMLYSTTSLDLGADLASHWECCLRASEQVGLPEREQTLSRSAVLRRKLLTNAEAVGHFSSVDGCVVLTRDFNVLGFGAKINASAELAESSPRRFANKNNTDFTYSDTDFMKGIGGTRHQSSARLCQIHPGIVVLTLSQDGDFKIFESDENHAYAWGPLHLPTIDIEDIFLVSPTQSD